MFSEKVIKNFYRKKKILITGGTGFVGQNLINEISKYTRSNQIFITSRKNFKKKNCIKLDLLKRQNVEKQLSKYDLIFHLASEVGSEKFHNSLGIKLFQKNLSIFLNILDHCKKNRKTNLILISSSLVYGYKHNLINTKDNYNNEPDASKKYYVWEKRTEEMLAMYNLKKLKIFRIFNTYGPYEKYNVSKSHVISSLIKKSFLSKSGNVKINGNPNNIRNFIHINDVVKIITQLTTSKKAPQIVNICSNENIKIKNLAKIIIKKVEKIRGMKLKPQFNLKKLPITIQKANNKKLYKFSKFKFISLNSGIDQSINFFLKFRKI